MAYADESTIRELWRRIGSTFAQLSQAGVRTEVYGGLLYLYAADGSLLDTTPLPGGLDVGTADGRYAASMEIEGNYLVLKNKSGDVLSRIPKANLK